MVFPAVLIWSAAPWIKSGGKLYTDWVSKVLADQVAENTDGCGQLTVIVP
jgi:hypothetical protein